MKTARAALFLAVACAIAAVAQAQDASGRPSPASCPRPAEVGPLHLYGLWHAEFGGLAQGATVLFERHPELADSVRGGVNRDGSKSLAAGDVEQGEFTLEESLDGQHISATWLGSVVPDTCGKEIRGTWSRESNPVPHPFVLRKLPGWR